MLKRYSTKSFLFCFESRRNSFFVCFRSRLDDYSAPVAMAGRRYSQQIKTNPNTDSVNESGVCCEVCQKTKFVDEQSARQCSICKKRFCVRCGVRLKGHPNNKVCVSSSSASRFRKSFFSDILAL